MFDFASDLFQISLYKKKKFLDFCNSACSYTIIKIPYYFVIKKGTKGNTFVIPEMGWGGGGGDEITVEKKQMCCPGQRDV
jgi:hypothetical protein